MSPVTCLKWALQDPYTTAVISGHGTASCAMLNPLLTLQVSYLSNCKGRRSSNPFLLAVSCPNDLQFLSIWDLCIDTIALGLSSQLILLLSSGIELNPGPPKDSEIVGVLDSIKRIEDSLETIWSEIADLKTTQAPQEKLISAISDRLDSLEFPKPRTSNPNDTNASSQISRKISVPRAATIDATNCLRCNNLTFSWHKKTT